MFKLDELGKLIWSHLPLFKIFLEIIQQKNFKRSALLSALNVLARSKQTNKKTYKKTRDF